MSAIAALFLAAAPSALPAESDVIVVTRRLESWRGRLNSRPGEKAACRTTRSTGDRAIDAIGCQTLISCIAPVQPQMLEIANSHLGRDEKRVRLDALAQTRVPCLERVRDEGIAALTAQRRAR